MAIDEEKAPFIQQAFKMYATGDHSVLEVRDFLFEKGFVSVFGNRIAHSKMIDILKNMTEEQAIFELNGALDATIIRPAADKQYICVIMPMRLT